MARIALFASGTASNARRILEYNGYRSSGTSNYSAPAGTRRGRIVCAISDRKNSGIHALSEAAGIPCTTVSYQPGRAQAERTILAVLREFRVDLLVLAGYMRILGPSTVRAYRDRIVNIHPSLLPAFPGMNAIERSFAAGMPRGGVTVHIVNEGVDTGRVLAQASFDRSLSATLKS
ncbi:MAG: formyltransferase family protein, partial [Spirochaetaceae bacterium]